MGQTFWDVIEHRAKEFGDQPVLSDNHGRTIGGIEFRDRAESVAAGLAERGVVAGSVVSWLLPTRIDTLILVAALARLGAVQQPIIPLLGEREVAHLTSISNPSLLISVEEIRGTPYGERARRLADERGFAVLIHDADHPLPEGDASTLGDPPTDAEQPRWLYATSGTSSEPKAVWHCDRSVVGTTNGYNSSLPLVPDDVYPVAFPVAHIGGAAMLLSALMGGYSLMLFDSFDAQRSPIQMSEAGATMLGSALPFIRSYIAAQRAAGDEVLFPKLKFCVSGGAPKPPTLDAEIREVLGGLGLVSSYGLTECPMFTVTSFEESAESRATTEGRPVPGADVHICAPDGTRVADGEEGEIRVAAAPQLMLGYANAVHNAEGFDEQGRFRTGDLGRFNEFGALQVTGRLKEIIIRNAENISTKEVGDTILSHPQVADAAVVGVPDARTGERCVAAVVPVDGAELDLAAITAHCRQAGLAVFKLPEDLVILEQIPRSGLGKVATAELRTTVLAALGR